MVTVNKRPKRAMGITRTSLGNLHIRLQQYIVLQLQQLLVEGIHHLECGVHDEVK